MRWCSLSGEWCENDNRLGPPAKRTATVAKVLGRRGTELATNIDRESTALAHGAGAGGGIRTPMELPVAF